MLAASLIVCFSILTAVQGASSVGLLISLVVALISTGLEAFSKYGIDNLTVPVGSAAAAYGLSLLLA